MKNKFNKFKPLKDMKISGKTVQVFNDNPIPKKSVIKNVYDKIPDDTNIPLQFMTRKQYMNKYMKNQEKINNVDFPISKEKNFIKQRTPHYSNITGRYTTKNNPYYPPTVVVFNDKNNQQNIKGDNFRKLAWHEYGHELAEKENINLPLKKEERFADNISEFAKKNEIYSDKKAKNYALRYIEKDKYSKNMPYLYSYRPKDEDPKEVYPSETQKRMSAIRDTGWTGTGVYAYGSERKAQEEEEGFKTIDYQKGPRKLKKIWSENPKKLDYDFEYGDYEKTSKKLFELKKELRRKEEKNEKYDPKEEDKLRTYIKIHMEQIGENVSEEDIDYAIEQSKESEEQPINFLMKRKGYDALIADKQNDTYRKGSIYYGGKEELKNKLVETDSTSKNDKVYFPRKLKEQGVSFDTSVSPRKERILTKILRKNPELLTKKGTGKVELGMYSNRTAFATTEPVTEKEGNKTYFKIGEYKVGFKEDIFNQKYDPNFVRYVSEKRDVYEPSEKYLEEERKNLPKEQKLHSSRHDIPRSMTHEFEHVKQIEGFGGNIAEFKESYDKEEELYGYKANRFETEAREAAEEQEEKRMDRKVTEGVFTDEWNYKEPEEITDDEWKEMRTRKEPEPDKYSENKWKFWKKEEPEPENYPDITNEDVRSEIEYRQKLQEDSYGKVNNYSGKQVGNTMIGVDMVLPSGKVLTAAGLGVKKYVDKVKVIKTDEHDNKYKIPKLEIHRKTPQSDNYSEDKN